MNETKLAGYTIKYPNQKEFALLKEDIFGHNIYDFDFKTDTPFIVDVGSHIGLSVLYFKSRYPNSKILAFEPNPSSFETLNENIFLNNLQDIETFQIAIANSKGNAQLFVDNSDDKWNSNSSLLPGGWTGLEKLSPIDIQTQSLTLFIDRKVDLLKIDVEGTELSVLNSINGVENIIDNIVMEYHPSSNLKKILSTFSKYRFNVSFTQNGKEVKNPNPKSLFIIRASRK
jgi:FkbM family methyltransferase